MVRAGYSPSVRLFEAAACATPVISDAWPGLESFFTPDEEIFIAGSSEESRAYLQGLTETERRAAGERARARVLGAHTALHRAQELESYVQELISC
jgi:spore maturation protein CgeB